MENFLIRLAGFATVATVLIIVASVCHEWGYFWIIGSRFQTFLTWSEYFSNATTAANIIVI
jgi:hypothetical protein